MLHVSQDRDLQSEQPQQQGSRPLPFPGRDRGAQVPVAPRTVKACDSVGHLTPSFLKLVSHQPQSKLLDFTRCHHCPKGTL